MLKQQVKKADMCAVSTEFAWDMNWCDPGAADPLSFEALRSLGVLSNETSPDFIPGRGRRSVMPPMGGGRDVFVTRMHVRSNSHHFPGDLFLQETADRSGG
jgi:hypothetical protein